MSPSASARYSSARSAVSAPEESSRMMSSSNYNDYEEGSSSRSCLVLFSRTSLNKQQQQQQQQQTSRRRQRRRPPSQQQQSQSPSSSESPGRRSRGGNFLPSSLSSPSPRDCRTPGKNVKQDNDAAHEFSEDASLLDYSEPAGYFLSGNNSTSGNASHRKAIHYQPKFAEEEIDQLEAPMMESPSRNRSNKMQSIHEETTQRTRNMRGSSSLSLGMVSPMESTGRPHQHQRNSRSHLLDLEQRLTLNIASDAADTGQLSPQEEGTSQVRHPATVEQLLTLPKATDRRQLRRQKYEQEASAPAAAAAGGAREDTSSPSVIVRHLLTLPKPTDRSHQRRQKYEREGLNLGEFLPEQEPKGVRGQEATVDSPSDGEGVTSSSSSSPLAAIELPKANPSMTIRILPTTQEESGEENEYNHDENDLHDMNQHPQNLDDYERPFHSAANHPDTTATTIIHPMVTPQTSQDHTRQETSQSNYVSYKMTSKSVTPERQPPRSVPKIPANNSPSDESTNSDVNIEQMMLDLMPSFSPDPSAETKRITNSKAMLSSSPQLPTLPHLPRDVKPNNSNRGQATISPSALESMLTTRNAPSPSASFGSNQFVSTSKDDPTQQQVNQTVARQPVPVHASPSTPRSQPALQSSLASPASSASVAGEKVDELNAEAIKLVHSGDYDLALTKFARVLHLYRSLYGDLHPLVASTYHNLGMVHSKRATFMLDNTLHQGHVRAQALQCFQAAARTARDSPLLGPNHPNVSVSLVRIGFLLLQSRQYQHAITTFQEALRIRMQAYGPRHGLVANLYNNLGVCYMHTGDYPRGRQFLDMALELQEEQVERLRQEQDEHEAEEQGREAVLTTARLELADTLCNIGGLCLEWIRKQGPDARHATDAQAAFANAYEIRYELLGPKHPMVLQVRSLYDMSTSIPVPISATTPSPKRRNHTGSQKTRNLINVDEEQPGAHHVSSTHQPVHSYSNITSQPFQISPEQVAQTLPPLPLRSAPTADGVQVRDGMQGKVSDKPSPSQSAASPSPPPVDPNVPPPITEVTVTPLDIEYEEDDKDEILDETPNEAQSGSEGYTWREPTKIYMVPLFVPPLSHNRNDVTFNGSAGESNQPPDLARSSGSETSGGSMQRNGGYDTEESCLIRDSGVESDHGRVHFPTTWSKDETDPSASPNDLFGSSDEDDEGVSPPPSKSHDVMVVRPYAKENTHNHTNADDEILFFLPKPKSLENHSPSWEASILHRPSERESFLSRAKELLARHGELESSQTGDIDQVKVNRTSPNRGAKSQSQGVSPTRMSDGNAHSKNSTEDGTAALGGNWPSLAAPGSVIKLTQAMLREPELHLREIHEAAIRYIKLDKLVEALQLFEIILDCQRRRHGPLHQDVAAAQHNVGIVLLRSERLEEALEAFDAAVRVRKGSLGRDHPEVAVSLVKVGITSFLLHRFEDALWNFREALSVRKHALGALHPSTARIYNNVGCVHVEFNELRDARRAFESALDIQRNGLCHEPESGPLMFGTATTLCNLGFLYRSRDMHGKAALVLREAFELQRIVLGSHHPTVLSTLDCLADACSNSAQSVAALRNYNEILARIEEARNSGGKRRRRAVALLLYKISQVHRQQNDREAQIEKLMAALKMVRSISDFQEPANDSEFMLRLQHRIQTELQQAKDELRSTPFDWV